MPRIDYLCLTISLMPAGRRATLMTMSTKVLSRHNQWLKKISVKMTVIPIKLKDMSRHMMY